jgi:FdhE protein
MDEALTRWLEAHPYLDAVARFHEVVEEAAAGAGRSVALPGWDACAQELARGVPLLRSAAASVEVAAAAADLLLAVAEGAAVAELPPKLLSDVREVRELVRAPAERERAVGWLLHGEPDSAAPRQAGLVRFLGWTALRHALAPTVAAFAGLREEGAWGREICPTCGAPPAMAQLAGGDPVRFRLLACGGCGTRWRWRRLGCPGCGNEDPARLEVLELEDARLRIDACQACGGYLKTYVGEGEEAVLLADWTTLHLDLLAKDRGLQRLGASLYEL